MRARRRRCTPLVDRGGRTPADWATLARPQATDACDELLITGIRAVDLFAPLCRGDRQYWPPVVKVGQLVLPFAIADALRPTELWWIGFASGGQYAQRRDTLTDTLRQVADRNRDKLVVLMTARGMRHATSVAMHTLATDPSVIATIVIEPKASADEKVKPQPAEGYDSQLAFDPTRARRRLFPAIDPFATVPRSYPSAGHEQIAQRARDLLLGYQQLDPELELPDPATLTTPELAAAAQELVRYLAQPLRIGEPFHAKPGQSTPYAEMLDRVQEITDPPRLIT